MRNRFMSSVAVLLVLLASSCVTFAQSYGTKGYSPGAWKPDELPKGLLTPKPFDPHSLSGIWSMPTKPGYFERHSLNDKPIKIAPNVPPQMGSDAYPHPMTPWGKEKLDQEQVSYAPIAVPQEEGKDICTKQKKDTVKDLEIGKPIK